MSGKFNCTSANVTLPEVPSFYYFSFFFFLLLGSLPVHLTSQMFEDYLNNVTINGDFSLV